MNIWKKDLQEHYKGWMTREQLAETIECVSEVLVPEICNLIADFRDFTIAHGIETTK
jgi:hypothetical protein